LLRGFYIVSAQMGWEVKFSLGLSRVVFNNIMSVKKLP